jgi:hypothetical protein
MNDVSAIESEFGDLTKWAKGPSFWVAKLNTGMPFIKSLKEVVVQKIGKSAGGREARLQ